MEQENITKGQQWAEKQLDRLEPPGHYLRLVRTSSTVNCEGFLVVGQFEVWKR